MNKPLSACLLLSCAAFAHIKPGSLSVKAGTTWSSGQKVSISWSASIDHNKSPYTLWFSPDGGRNWNVVKTGIPGQASNVAVTYEWTVPASPTTNGMLRVFQTFGGSVATSPSNPGDYTLFSPAFTISTSTGIAANAPPRNAPSIRVAGEHLEIRLPSDRDHGEAVLEVLGADGSLRRSIALGRATTESRTTRLRIGDIGLAGTFLLRARIDGRSVAHKRVVLTH